MANMQHLFRFRPTDEELFAHYLVGKATGAPLPPGLIEERDIYSEEPWKIFDVASDRTFYVFTTLRKKKSRVLRTAGAGTWKEQHTVKIRNGNGELVGHKKSFKFKGGSGSIATSGRWIMYEFSMRDETQCKCVLCRIKYYKDEKKSEEKAIVISNYKPVQIEEENRRAKRLCLHDDHNGRTNVIYDSAAALLSSTVDQARPAASQAITSGITYAETPQVGAAAAKRLDIDDSAFTGLSGDAKAYSLPPMATITIQRSSDEWMKGWMTMELDAVVNSGYNSQSVSLPPMEEGYRTNLLARASSPPTTTTTTSSDPIVPAIGSNDTLNSLFTTAGPEAATMQRDIHNASYSSAFGCDGHANVLPTIATSAEVDAGDTTYPAFDGGAYADLLPPMADPVESCEWMNRLMDNDTDPVIPSNYLSYSNPFDDPWEGDTDAMLASTLDALSSPTWDPTSLHQQRSAAESQEQDVPVTLAWADRFLRL